ncbi:hypothetical protein NQ318_004173 [Aromia moschata]|uniref:Uncharacterized protein n=1 Tax=Aromia moschata TaxID=1265417 RepID=A0AAV8XM96_9CUCU|nr:hypothetical protein NQ318_004173 [Aromia moschata]
MRGRLELRRLNSFGIMGSNLSASRRRSKQWCTRRHVMGSGPHENLLSSPQIKPQSNGSVRISLSNGLSKNFAKSTSDLTGYFDADNRIMINVNHDKKSEAPNGILKNGGGNTNTLPTPTNHKPLVQQKSITFGEILLLRSNNRQVKYDVSPRLPCENTRRPVVIKDRPMVTS